jgi:hypothetical protein
LPALQPKGGDPRYWVFLWSLYSVVPKTAGLLLGPMHIAAVLNPTFAIVWLPSVLYFVGLFVIIRRGRVPQWCWGPLTLAMTQLLVPASLAYNTIWAIVGAVWFAGGSLVNTGRDEPPDDDNSFVLLRVLLVLALTMTLTPSVFTIVGRGGFPTTWAPDGHQAALLVTGYLSPILLLVTMMVSVVWSYLPRRFITAVPEARKETTRPNTQST